MFDFENKYTPGMAREVFPAEIPNALEVELQELALGVHQVLKLRDFSRVDFRLDGGGHPVCLEANTLPGMTPTSLLPQGARASGISFEQLCVRMIESALERERLS